MRGGGEIMRGDHVGAINPSTLIQSCQTKMETRKVSLGLAFGVTRYFSQSWCIKLFYVILFNSLIIHKML
jgi:hypothetical protein